MFDSFNSEYLVDTSTFNTTVTSILSKLSYSFDLRETQMYTAGYMDEDGVDLDEFSQLNDFHTSRINFYCSAKKCDDPANIILAENVPLVGQIMGEHSFVKGLIPPGVEIGFYFTKQDDEVIINSKTPGRKYRIQITRLEVYLCRQTLKPSKHEALIRDLAKKPGYYKYTRLNLDTRVLPGIY